MIKEYEQINTELQNRIKYVLPDLRVDVEGTVIRNIIDPITAQIADAYVNVDEERKRVLPSTARGDDLTSLAEFVGIFRGADESDSALRIRMRNFFKMHDRSNMTAIITELYNIDDIAQVVVREHMVGVGSFVIYLLPVGTSFLSTTLSNAQTVVDKMQALGCRGIVREGNVGSVQIKINLIYTNDVSAQQINTNTIKSQCISSLLSYLNNMRVGEPLVYSSIITLCRNSSPYIADIIVDYIRVNGAPILSRNYYPSEFEVLRPATNSAILIA